MAAGRRAAWWFAWLVVVRGSRVTWRYAVLYQAVGWGVPAVSVAVLAFGGYWGDASLSLGVCWVPPSAPGARFALYYGWLFASLVAMVVVLFQLFRAMGHASAPRRIVASKRLQLGLFIAASLLLNGPFVALRIHEGLLAAAAIP